MGFDIISARSMGGDFEAEAELQMGSRIHDYIIRITRSGGDPIRETRSMRKLIAPGMKGLYITTETVDSSKVDVERTEVSGAEKFYELMKEYNILPSIQPSEVEGRTLPSASEIDRLMEWGDEFFKKKNYPNALEYYEKAVDQKPEAIKPRLMKSEVLMKMGHIEEAKDVLIKSIERGMRSPDLWTSLGKTLHELGEYEEEIEAYDRALDINEDHIDAWRNKGATLYEEGLYDEAELCFDRVLEVEPRDEGAWNNKGLCLFKKGDLAAAIHCIDNALEIHPKYIDALINKALVLENQNKISAALRIMDKLVNLRPERSEFHYIRSAYLEALGDIEEAYHSAEKALKLNPGHTRTKGLKERLEERLESIPEPKRKIVVEAPEDTGDEKEILYDKIQGLEKDIDSLKEEKQKFEEEVKEEEELKRALEEKDKELERLKEEKMSLEKEISSVWEDRLKEDSEVSQIVEERDQLRSTLKSKEIELEDLMDLKDQLPISDDGEREKLQSEIDKKRKEIEDLAEKKEDVSREVQEFLKDIEELRDKKESLERHITELEEKMPSEDMDDLIEEKENALKQLDSKQEEIEKLKRNQERLLEDLARYRREEKEKEKVLKESQKKEKIVEEDSVLKRKANILYCMGEYEKVLEIVGDANNKDILNIKGCCYHALGMEERSERMFREAKDLLVAKYNLEELLFNQGRYEEAGDISDQIMDDMKGNTVFWEKRGELMGRLERFDDALLSYHKASEVSGNLLFDAVKAETKYRVEIDGVESAIEEIKAKGYSSPYMNYLLGTYLYISREYKKSMKMFRDAVEVPVALHNNNLGCAAYQLERYGEALSAFEKSVELKEDEIYLNNLGFCQLERNLLEAAESTFDKAVNLAPNDASSWYHLGIAMKRLDKDGWKGKVERALDLREDFEAARKLLKT